MTPCVVIPLRNDAAALRNLIGDLREHAGDWSVIVVDGASTDGGAALAKELTQSRSRRAGACPRPCLPGDDPGRQDGRPQGSPLRKAYEDEVLLSRPGRGHQLRLGAERAIERGHDWLWFLHADSRVSGKLAAALERIPDRPAWGRCDVAFDTDDRRMQVIATAMNLRSAATHICTGDQGIFAHRHLLEAVGGVPELPLMEDVELSRHLRRIGRPVRLRTPLVTSARRWQQDGILPTVLKMWSLRARYHLGESAETLANEYYAP